MLFTEIQKGDTYGGPLSKLHHGGEVDPSSLIIGQQVFFSNLIFIPLDMCNN